MNQVALIVDVEKCCYCNNCFLSDKDEHVGNDWLPTALAQPRHGHRWIDILRKERGTHPMVDVAYLPTMCNQCRRPSCAKAGPSGAVYQRSDGIVIIDPIMARGHREIVEACPYGHIWWNDEEQVPQKWTMNAHLLDSGWHEPRCTQTCPTEALRFVTVDDGELAALVADERLEVLHPEWDTGPRVYYRNLYRYASAFVGGTLTEVREGREECAAGVGVALLRAGTEVASTTSDVFGEFKFDGLGEGSGAYEVVARPGSAPAPSIPVVLGSSVYLGIIPLP